MASTPRVRGPRRLSHLDDGHDANIVDVQETWFSPDLKIVVFSKHTSTDLRADQTTMEIRQLDRREPDAALFEIPADYKIVDVNLP
jgi:hypothetical protein